MDLTLPSDLRDIDAAIAELCAQASKDALASYARGRCGWRGDDARTSKTDIARAILEWHAAQSGSGSTESTQQQQARELEARFPGKCAHCLGAIQKGERIKYVKALKQAYHPACFAQAFTEGTAAEERVHGGDTEESSESMSTKKKAPASVEAKNSQAIAQAIAAALGSLKLGADPEEIRAAVKAEIAPLADQLRKEVMQQVFRVEVKLPDGTVQDVGRQHKQFPMLVKALAAGCNVWLAGPAGSGKTTAAEAAAKALNLPFSFDGAMDTEYKVVGFTDAQGRIVSTAFRKAYTEGGVHLFDECDASLAPATLAINAALANGYAAFPDGMAKKHPNFRCIAAANTWGLGATFDYVGRNKLDAAFLDRFVSLTWEYDENLERALCGDADWCTYVQNMRAKAKQKGVKVVISPRASLYGAQLLAAGVKRDDVIDLTMRAKMRAEDWKALQS